MSFEWKNHKDIWKGEGIYHLTFVVTNRRPLLGELVPLPRELSDDALASSTRPYLQDVKRPPNTDMPLQPPPLPYERWRKELCTSELATVRLSAFAQAILHDLHALPERYNTEHSSTPAISLCGKQFMPDHLHVILWIKKDVGKSIRQIAQGFRIGVRKRAVEMGVWNNSDGHPFGIPFIRTLSRAGQLHKMIEYVHANPDNAWMRRLHPDLYTIRRNQQHAGLTFDTMGKARLLDYPDHQVIALPRNLTQEQIEHEVNKAKWKAERGVVTYTAAINNGESAVAKAIREAGFPLVVMMLDGFPAEGTEAARYFHPSGVYHKACGEGLLFLMAPHSSNYNNPELISLTEAELRRKAEEKHQPYTPLPRTSTRWRMIAGNMMLRMLANR